MIRTSARAGLGPAMALVAVAVAGCNTSQSDRNADRSPSSTPAKQRTVQEAKTLKTHGEQLKAKGDETGGERLIEQSKVKEAESKVQTQPGQPPQTKPQ